MGQPLSVVEFPQCLLLEIEASKGAKLERLLLVPLTPQTVPKQNSPLIRILLEAEYENSARQWAWPPVSGQEDSNGPSDIRNDALYSGLDRSNVLSPAPTVAQCYHHAVAKERRQPSYSRRYGHLFSLLAVTVPDTVILPSHRTSWVPWSAALMQELLDNKATAAGLYRYHHFHTGNVNGSFAGSPTASLDMSFSAPPASLDGSFAGPAGDQQERAARTLAAVDYYLFRDFCYEAKASVLLQGATYFIENYPPVGTAQASTKPPATFPGQTLLRCRTANVPQVRLMQKLYRLHLAQQSGISADQLALYHYGDNDEILHCKISSTVREELRVALLGAIRTGADGKCSVARDATMAASNPTPFDAAIAQSKDVWSRENAPVKATPTEVPPVFREAALPVSRSMNELAAAAGGYLTAAAHHQRTTSGTPVSPEPLENQSFAACSEVGENSSFAFPSYTVQSSQGPSLVASFVTAPPEYLSLRITGSPQPEDTQLPRSAYPSPAQQILAVDRDHRGTTTILPNKTGYPSPAANFRSRSLAPSPKPAPAPVEDTSIFLVPTTPVYLSQGDGEWHRVLWRNEVHPTMPFQAEDANGWVQLVAYGDIFVWDSEKRPMVMPCDPNGRPTYIAVDPRTAVYTSDPALPLTPCGELVSLWAKSLA